MRFVIVGAGKMGVEYATRHLGSPTRTSVVAVVDPDARAAGRLSRAVGGGCRPHSSLGEALAAGECEAVYIAAPPAAHAALACEALAAGKHVLLEKPLAASASDADAIVAAAEQAAPRGAALCVNIGMRWNSAVHELQRRMPALGELKRCALRLHFKQWPRKWQDQRWVAERAEGGPLREVGTHWVFALLEVFGGGSVAKVRCDIAYADGPSGTLCETTAEGTLQLCSGLAVELSVLTQAPVADDVSELELEGEGGGLLFYDWACLRDLAAPAGSVPLVEDQEYGRRDSVRSLHGDGGAARPAVTAREARAAQRVIDALLRSNGRWTEVSYA
eukprot:TRINITY_DN28678_c0_g1_i1.p1 TRINITY_DN28678_c0_g1~~TRINITY_DN28678_c0_g1_i1.p1  ORF type:complete len:332 (+),score=102.85 TRINITY_DN28678_c0_g1_i1:72-1067(+)